MANDEDTSVGELVITSVKAKALAAILGVTEFFNSLTASGRKREWFTASKVMQAEQCLALMALRDGKATTMQDLVEIVPLQTILTHTAVDQRNKGSTTRDDNIQRTILMLDTLTSYGDGPKSDKITKAAMLKLAKSSG